MWTAAETCFKLNGCEPTVWEQPQQTASCISMELVSLWDRDQVLYSMASHCCFQQTVHHYSVWQESKHCAFTRVKKKAAPLHLFLLSPSSASSSPFVSPLFLASPCMYVLFHSLCSFLFCNWGHGGMDTYLAHTFSNKTYNISYKDSICTINYLLPQTQGCTFSNKSIFIGSLSGTQPWNLIWISYFLIFSSDL